MFRNSDFRTVSCIFLWVVIRTRGPRHLSGSRTVPSRVAPARIPKQGAHNAICGYGEQTRSVAEARVFHTILTCSDRVSFMQMLDENHHLIQCIMDYQSKGKTAECTQWVWWVSGCAFGVLFLCTMSSAVHWAGRKCLDWTVRFACITNYLLFLGWRVLFFSPKYLRI